MAMRSASGKCAVSQAQEARPRDVVGRRSELVSPRAHESNPAGAVRWLLGIRHDTADQREDKSDRGEDERRPDH